MPKTLLCAFFAACLVASRLWAQPVTSFEALDRDGDRRLSAAEASVDRALEVGFHIADRNRDRMLDRREHDAAMALNAERREEERFAGFDANGDGVLDENEFRLVSLYTLALPLSASAGASAPRPATQSSALFRRLDRDGDGYLSDAEL